MRRDAGAAVLFALGGVVFEITLSGQYLRYVRPGQEPWLLSVATMLVLVGLGGLVFGQRDAPDRTVVDQHEEPVLDDATSTGEPSQLPHVPDTHHPSADHDHHGSPRAGWLLFLPVLVVLVVPPPALGAWAAARAGATVPRPAAASFHPGLLPAGSPVDLSVRDYAERAVWDSGRSLSGRTVSLTGFVTPRSDGPGWYLARAVITCCAADARSYLVEVDTPNSPLPRNTWIQVVGTWVPSTSPDPGTATPRIAAQRVDPVSTPTDPYE